MANIGAGESLHAYLVKKEDINIVDAYVKNVSPTVSVDRVDGMIPFRYRFLSTSEMTFQPISAHLKGKFDGVLYTSETDISVNERDKVYFVDGLLQGKYLTVTRVLPQVHIGAFVINKKYPKIIELA